MELIRAKSSKASKSEMSSGQIALKNLEFQAVKVNENVNFIEKTDQFFSEDYSPWHRCCVRSK